MRAETMEVPVALLVSLAVLAIGCLGALVAMAVRHGARLRRLDAARNDVLERLALVAEFREHRTREHGEQVARTAGRIAQRAGLSSTEARDIARAARLLDIGMVAIPDSLMRDPGPLTPDDRAVVESHTLVGAELLAGEPGLLALAAEIALSHHEHWDGRGYPHGLRGTEIPLSGRIVAVADAFHDKLRRGRPVQLAVAEIERLAGSDFDPAVVYAFSGLPHHELCRREVEPAA